MTDRAISEKAVREMLREWANESLPDKQFYLTALADALSTLPTYQPEAPQFIDDRMVGAGLNALMAKHENAGDGYDQAFCRDLGEVQRFICDSLFGVHTVDGEDATELADWMRSFNDPDNWHQGEWVAHFEDGSIRALCLKYNFGEWLAARQGGGEG